MNYQTKEYYKFCVKIIDSNNTEDAYNKIDEILSKARLPYEEYLKLLLRLAINAAKKNKK